MLNLTPDLRQGWLLFKDGNHPFRYFLKRNFGHISILIKDDYNWIMIDPSYHSLQVKILPFNVIDNVPKYYIERYNMKCLYVSFWPIKRRLIGWKLFGIVHCVTIAKYVLGLRTWSLTPWQLFKTLTNMKDGDKYKNGLRLIERVI